MTPLSLTYKKGLKDGLPIGLGYLSVSFAFGVTAVSLGIPELIALLISATNLTSAGQLAGVAVIAVLGSVFEIILTQLVINARYFLMSLTLTQKLDKKFTLLDRLLCAVGITDEIFAVAVTQEKPVTRNYFLGLMTLPYIGWTGGTILGAVLGGVLPSFIVNALNIALYAMFIAIFVPATLQNKKIIPVILISVAISCAFTFIPVLNTVNAGFVYVIAALVAAIIGAIIFPIDDESPSNDKGGDV
ncbi:MAG: AzlC family ABC transporter permease [Clostridia bacterium]|nr:AzlC family ABC transporter permease [Clostridia bacterium]